MGFLTLLILFSILLFVYVYFVYPALLYLFSLGKNFTIKETVDEYKKISVLIAAYNEEDYIEDCVKSVLSSDYPEDKYEILVGSDGSDDNTDAIVGNMTSENDKIKLFRYERLGKNQVINRLSDNMTGEIMVVLDADCRLKYDTLEKTNRVIDNESKCIVYAVDFPNNEDNAGAAGETLYQKYDRFLREKETLIHSNVNSLGSHAISFDIFKKFPNDRVCDDLYSLLQTLSCKKKVIFNNQISITDVRERSFVEEFPRRKRLVGGGLATIFSFPELLSPANGWKAFFLWSHKLLRWYSSVFLLLGFLSSLFLTNTIFGLTFAYIFTLILILSLIGYLLEKGGMSNPLKIPLFFVSMNIGFLQGIIQFYKGKQNAIWSRKGLD